MSEISPIKKYIAELIGTFVLVFVGCGAGVFAGGNIGYLGVAFAFGLSVVVMAYTIGPISGCHINPAITIAMMVAKKIGIKDGIIYIVMQFIGAIIGAAIVFGVAISEGVAFGVANGYGVNSPEGYGLGSGFVVELVVTFIFLLVIFGATSEKAHSAMAGLAIGVTLFIALLVSIPITNGSLNPARSLGPAIFAGAAALGDLWLFFVAPIIGAVCAALVWKYVLGK